MKMNSISWGMAGGSCTWGSLPHAQRYRGTIRSELGNVGKAMPVIRPVIDRPENWRETSERHVVALRTRFREEFYDDLNILLCHAAEFSGMYGNGFPWGCCFQCNRVAICSWRVAPEASETGFLLDMVVIREEGVPHGSFFIISYDMGENVLNGYHFTEKKKSRGNN